MVQPIPSSLEVLQQAVFGDWFDPIHAEDVIFSVAVTDGCLPTLEILSITAEEDPAVAYLTGLSPHADTGQCLFSTDDSQ